MELNWELKQAQAKRMTMTALHYARQDCYLAAIAAEKMEAAGNRVSKTGGYYRDEASVFFGEIRRRKQS